MHSFLLSDISLARRHPAPPPLSSRSPGDPHGWQSTPPLARRLAPNARMSFRSSDLDEHGCMQPRTPHGGQQLALNTGSRGRGRRTTSLLQNPPHAVFPTVRHRTHARQGPRRPRSLAFNAPLPKLSRPAFSFSLGSTIIGQGAGQRCPPTHRPSLSVPTTKHIVKTQIDTSELHADLSLTGRRLCVLSDPAHKLLRHRPPSKCRGGHVVGSTPGPKPPSA